MLPALLRSTRANLDPERLNEMSAQVNQLFPHVPIDLIQQDLRQTHSIEITVENILEDRLSRTRTANVQNGLNEIDDTDGDDEEEEYEENTSSEDDLLNNTNNTVNQSQNTDFSSNRPVNRRRNNFIS